MIVSRPRRYVLGLCAALAVLAGCGMPPSQLGAPSAPQRSAISPSARGDLLYVTGGCGGTCVFSYPKGKLVGSLTQGGTGLCSDKRGNVFMATAASGNAVVYEYAHGGTTPIATLTLDGLLAEGCGVDPKTGNLAVTYLCQDCDYAPVAVFTNATGSPTIYKEDGVFLSYCGYDKNGNLFADGTDLSQQFALAELPYQGSSLGEISVNQTINNAGQVQWDGTNLAIEDLIHPVIYRFKVSGSSATLAGTTKLTGAGDSASQSWIEGGNVVVPFDPKDDTPKELGFWKYPGGGAVKKVVKRHISASYLAGATVSVAR